MTEADLSILLGVLSDPRSGMRIGFSDCQWVLAVGEDLSYEVLVSHEDWRQFVALVGEYSDTGAS